MTNRQTQRPTGIKSIQQFTIAFSTETSLTATITAVNTAKARIIPEGYTSAATVSTDQRFYHNSLTLTNATTVTCARNAGGGISLVVSGTVVEDY